jgi:hypothetical protein
MKVTPPAALHQNVPSMLHYMLTHASLVHLHARIT